MTHFRFRYKRMGYLRWRCRTSRRPAVWAWLPPVEVKLKPSTPAWRRMYPQPEPPAAPPKPELRVGDYIVGENGDPQIQGHPDIRY